MSNRPTSFAEVLPPHATLSRAATKLFRVTTGLPAVLYTVSGSDLVVDSENSTVNFTNHCLEMMRLAPQKCHSCHKERARQALAVNPNEPSRCHAGLWNQAVPIVIDGKPQAVILYGQMRLESDCVNDESVRQHERSLRDLAFSDEDMRRLEQLYLTVQPFQEARLHELNTTLLELVGALNLEDARVQHAIARVVHCLSTQMQAIIAHAENMQHPTLQPSEVRRMGNDVLNQALALDATIQTLGNFLEEYDFELQPIEPLLIKAKEIYASEANRMGVKINLVVGAPPWPSYRISKTHMQHAMYNLVHNAVKYSFRSTDRYIQIESRHNDSGVSLQISNYGIGILPEEYEMIFRDGYQGELTRGENRTGSGKGLSFVRSVVEAHTGSIAVDSKPMPSDRSRPHLNRFTLWLPRA
ncbi:MAG: PocR ligand-binding domain-containing protein [Bryobacteraceae bacterium]